MDMTKTLKLQNCRLRKMNNELIKKVQHWKMVAADKDKEKFGLMQEINRLMLQLNMLRKRGDSCAQQLESAIMLSGQSVLSHLVESSTAVVNIIEVMKGYMEDRRKIDSSQLQWTNDSRSSDEVHQALPTSMDERSIQPVVSLPYWGLSEDSGGQKTQPLQNSELFNPLPNNSYNLDDSHSTDDLDLSDESKSYEKENNSTVSENQETYLSVVEEEDEETQCSSRRGRDENPSEGLLDASPSRSNVNYLGVTLDRRLSLKHHAIGAAGRSSAAATKLRPILKSRLPTRAKLALYR
ncbi:unnamed protein product [Leptosia nina]|uniref:Shugoshin C-terminal domain-containing protein n=1 Tax=Leptosia nina TaxID=320188 RepID=A0AAV1JZT9_9NEOP